MSSLSPAAAAASASSPVTTHPRERRLVRRGPEVLLPEGKKAKLKHATIKRNVDPATSAEPASKKVNKQVIVIARTSQNEENDFIVVPVSKLPIPLKELKAELVGYPSNAWLWFDKESHEKVESDEECDSESHDDVMAMLYEVCDRECDVITPADDEEIVLVMTVNVGDC